MYLKTELYELIRTDESIFDFIQESALDGLWYWDLENPENEWLNAKFWTVLGYDPDEMPHKSNAWQNIINQDDLKVATENFTMHCENPNHPYDQVVRYTHKNGSTKWIRCRGLAIRDNAGKPTRMLGAHQDITEFKRSEQELLKANEKAHESEEKYRAFYDNAPLSYQSLDENGCFIDINPMWLKTLGYESDEVIGKWYGDFLHPDSVEHFRKNFPAFKKRGSVSGVQFILRRKDNSYIYVSFEGCVGYTPDGSFKQTYCVFKDITDLKQAELALKESELKFRSLFEKGPIGIAYHKMIYDATGKPIDYFFLDANEAYHELTGVDPRGKLVTEAFPGVENDPFDWIGVFGTVARTGETIRFESYLVPNQRWYDCVGYQNKPGHFVAAFFETTKRKKAEIQLQGINENLSKKNAEIELNNKRLESLFKISQYSPKSIQELLDFALNEAIKLTHSKIGYICFYDESTKQFMLNSWSKEVMKECKVMNPKTIYELRKTGCWGEAVRQRKPIVINDYHEENPIKKGTPRGHVQLKKFLTIPVIIDNKIVAVCGVANKATDYDHSDIRQLNLLMDSVWKISERITLLTELTIAKEKAEESDRLKSAFLANMSHEIRTPMNGILGFSELLKTPNLSGEEQQKYIRIIEKSGARMLKIINDLVDISKIEAGVMQLHMNESNINEQVDSVYALFKPEADAKKINLSYKNPLPAREAIIKTDHDKVFAILSNLVKNAIKFTEKGAVELGYDLESGNGPKVLEFYIKDTGIGVPKDKQEAIFERFVQADIEDKMARQGAGLGLAISRAYVKMLGGKIWVESEEGQGSTFYFTLPYNAESVIKTNDRQLAPSEINNDVRRLKTLIVEDDEFSELLLDETVKTFSKEVLKARTGVEAVEQCRSNPDIDLVLMDIRMPEMGGYEATRKIREFNKEVTIIAQTAYGLAGDREKSIKAGCNDYITKPINRNELLAMIQMDFGK
jgi:PAS domain S-box-containing protein